jgi:hypothetical protein
MLGRLVLVRTDASEELSASIIRVKIIWVIFVILMMEPLNSCETLVVTRAIRRIILEDGIIHSHRCENLKSSVS